MRAHIAATGMPETFVGLHRGPIGKDEPFRILHPISIAAARRPNGDRASCPMCHQPNKFLEGKPAWFYELKAVAVIGHCCASAATRNEANAEYRKREARERAQDYLLEWLPRVPAERERALSLHPAAAECQHVFDRFRKDGGRYQQALRKACRGGEELSVTEILGPALKGGPTGMRTSGSSVETRDIRFGRLTGRAAVAATCSILSDLEACLITFDRFRIYGTENTALDFIVELDDNSKLAMAAELQGAIAASAKVRQGIAEFRSFFTAANMERITKWGTHAENPTRMTANLTRFGERRDRHFEVKDGGDRKVGIVINAVLWVTGSEAAEAA